MAMEEDIKFLWKWRKYLLLLATQVASVTYVAGLNPPGADKQWMPTVVSTDSRRYTALFYCNDAAFVASLVVIMFLLDRRISSNAVGLKVLRSAMLLDLLALMAAFVVGSCRDMVATIYVSALCALVFAYYVGVHLSLARLGTKTAEDSHIEERREFLLVLASFATPLTYAAGLLPPEGFWNQANIRYHAFFYANASTFVASLAIIMLLMSRSLTGQLARSYALPVCVMVELLSLMAAFAAGTSRSIPTTVYIITLIGAVLLYIVLQFVVAVLAMDTFKQWSGAVRRVLTCIFFLPDAAVNQASAPEPEPANAIVNAPKEENEEGARTPTHIHSNNGDTVDKVGESRSLLLLLGTLGVTVTYQAGLSPPGGVWPKGERHNIPGEPVQLWSQPDRYKAFYHCNTAAFVASLLVIIFVQGKEQRRGLVVRRAALNTVMILGLLGFMGAYVAGSSRDVTTTIYVLSLAVAVLLVYAIAKVMAYTAYGRSKLINWVPGVGKKLARALLRLLPDDEPGSKGGDYNQLERKRKFLLQLAIIAATSMYQTGLNPPGGFWPSLYDQDNTHFMPGDPVLHGYYDHRYSVFFYCNATGFMASVAVILLLVNQKLYRRDIRSNALLVCVVVGLLGLLGAYAAGSYRKLGTSIIVFLVLVAAVVTFLVLQILLYVSAIRHHWSEQPWLQCVKGLLKLNPLGPASAGENKREEVSAEQSKKFLRRNEVLILLGMLGASVTYQAGLAPPGGTLGDDETVSPRLGSPLLVAGNLRRYQAFFYCNATSFVASVVVIILMLLRSMKQRGAPLWAMQLAVVLDQFGLLGAYIAGSSPDWETSTYGIALVAVVLVFITLHVLLSFDAVLNKARKLMPWKYFGGGNDMQASGNGANV